MSRLRGDAGAAYFADRRSADDQVMNPCGMSIAMVKESMALQELSRHHPVDRRIQLPHLVRLLWRYGFKGKSDTFSDEEKKVIDAEMKQSRKTWQYTDPWH